MIKLPLPGLIAASRTGPGNHFMVACQISIRHDFHSSRLLYRWELPHKAGKHCTNEETSGLLGPAILRNCFQCFQRAKKEEKALCLNVLTSIKMSSALVKRQVLVKPPDLLSLSLFSSTQCYMIRRLISFDAEKSSWFSNVFFMYLGTHSFSIIPFEIRMTHSWTLCQNVLLSIFKLLRAMKLDNIQSCDTFDVFLSKLPESSSKYSFITKSPTDAVIHLRSASSKILHISEFALYFSDFHHHPFWV